jgi:23S rRNA (pseudouridine1915-N3)-methyltransferase
LRLRILAYGKLKTPGLADACAYYQRLLGAWVKCEVAELKPLPVPDKGMRREIQAREGEGLLERVPARFYLLDERGKARSTREWADEVTRWEGASLTEVGICVGSSLGFSEDVRARASGLLSLGPQTLSHELARAVLLEQLYRAWSVTRGHPYHVEGS